MPLAICGGIPLHSDPDMVRTGVDWGGTWKGGKLLARIPDMSSRGRIIEVSGRVAATAPGLTTSIRPFASRIVQVADSSIELPVIIGEKLGYSLQPREFCRLQA